MKKITVSAQREHKEKHRKILELKGTTRWAQQQSEGDKEPVTSEAERWLWPHIDRQTQTRTENKGMEPRVCVGTRKEPTFGLSHQNPSSSELGSMAFSGCWQRTVTPEPQSCWGDWDSLTRGKTRKVCFCRLILQEMTKECLWNRKESIKEILEHHEGKKRTTEQKQR